MMRCAIYCRVSTKDKGQTTENQSPVLREFAERQGWEVTEVYEDQASGKRGDRAAFLQMWEDAARHRFDVLLFWSLDRLSREGVLSTLTYLQRLTDLNIGYRSYTEQYLDSCGIFKDAVVSILATVAKQEKIRLSERTKAGLDRVRKRGIKLGRQRRVFDEVRARELRAGGASLSEIAAQVGVSIATLSRFF